MAAVKSRFVQHTWAAIAFLLVLGVLSMIWPSIIALSLGVLLLLQSFNDSQEIAALSWKEVSHVSIVLASLRRSGLPGIFS